MKHFVADSPAVTCRQGEPHARYRQWREGLAADDGLLLVDFTLEQYWLAGTPPVCLTAIYCVSGNRLGVAVSDQPLTVDGSSPVEQYQRWVSRHQLVDFNPADPLMLLPEHIAKPWGSELWYTAVERRGVCCFASGAASTPIPWLQAAVPGAAAGTPGQPLLLLKILDPAPDTVVGDLYFEIHEEKREVYVVTHIDRGAWPDGIGYIRYGFDHARIAQCESEAQFRANYLAAVQAYELVRRSLDGLPPGVKPTQEQLARERLLREAMNDFTSMRALREGDVVEIPVLMPHSLQHGVRVIEFQTPSYERKILSFAQQVLTQDHWDTPEAVAQMRLAPVEVEPFPCLYPQAGVRVEKIAELADFEVRRVIIEGPASWRLAAVQHYAVLIVVEGILRVSDSNYQAEQSVFLPRHWAGELVAAEAGQRLVLLVAMPCG